MNVFMKKHLIAVNIVFLCLFCNALKAQTGNASAQIVSVKISSNFKESTPDSANLSDPQPLKLTYDKNYLTFKFINAENPQQKSFAYRLIGLEYPGSWNICDNCSQVEYAHLDGGDYTFEVKVNEPDAVLVKFRFFIEGNIWHRWWFVPMLLLYALVVISIGIYFIVMFQFRQKLVAEQLVHKEKIDSMVELTAGIAHEIQNPLNFVNNFAELSIDIVQELDVEIGKESLDKEYIKELMHDLSQNQVKINHHGKRASSIVKNMLEHSRTSKGIKELTDINKLVDEYLRLSYHGLRAKDKNFNADFKTQFDENLPKIEVIQQDMGRVLMNLFNNAFYAVTQRKLMTNDENYAPSVFVSTQQRDNQIIIKIKDNGTGISESVKAKVFQPFFTTKPSGQGTGLGLSLAYDIVTKGHGGTLQVKTKEGEFTKFIIHLPYL